MWLLVATTLLGAAVACANEESSIEKKPRELVADLRRQLMQDNSDYSNERPKTPGPTLSNDFIRPENHSASQEPVNMAWNRTGALPEPSVSRKELLYYLDTDKLISYTPDDRRYKTLKVRHQFRRSGHRALLQEEGKEGVALVNLAGGPFPELRLPGARRQYQHDHGEADEGDDEMPPPPADRAEVSH